MKRHNKLFIAFSLALVTVIGASACSGSSGDSKKDGSGAGTSAATSVDEKQAKLIGTWGWVPDGNEENKEDHTVTFKGDGTGFYKDHQSLTGGNIYSDFNWTLEDNKLTLTDPVNPEGMGGTKQLAYIEDKIYKNPDADPATEKDYYVKISDSTGLEKTIAVFDDMVGTWGLMPTDDELERKTEEEKEALIKSKNHDNFIVLNKDGSARTANYQSLTGDYSYSDYTWSVDSNQVILKQSSNVYFTLIGEKLYKGEDLREETGDCYIRLTTDEESSS